MSAADVAVVILTFNEEIHIERAIDTVRSFAREIFVVDSFSTDRTVEIARAAGATVLQNRFVNQAVQFAWALEHAPITAGWILRLDADEVIGPDLAATLAERVPTLPGDVVGINFHRRHIFMGRWIRHGGRYPVTLLRVWRRGHGRIEDRWMDEHAVVWGGRTITLDGEFADHNLNDLTFFIAKHNSYATREAIQVLGQRYGLLAGDEGVSARAGSQAGLKRVIKERFYNRLPFWAGPLGYFFYRFVGQLGFLDGTPGLIYHVLQGFWYRFLVGAKITEWDRELALLSTKTERLGALERLTGHRIAALP